MIKELTTTEIATKYGVDKRVARRWCEEGRFPNAYQLPVTVGRGKAWLVPETDLEDFKPPTRGRKLSENPSKATVAKRRYREQGKISCPKEVVQNSTPLMD